MQVSMKYVLAADFAAVPTYIISIGLEFTVQIPFDVMQQIKGRLDFPGSQVEHGFPVRDRDNETGVPEGSLILFALNEQGELVLKHYGVLGAAFYITEYATQLLTPRV